MAERLPENLKRGHLWVHKSNPALLVQVETVATPTFDDFQKYVAFRQVGSNASFISPVTSFLKEYRYDDGS